MINVSDADMLKLLTLPKNEAGFQVLMNTMKSWREESQQEFSKAAMATVFNEDARPRALVISGKINAIDEIISLINKLVLSEDINNGRTG